MGAENTIKLVITGDASGAKIAINGVSAETKGLTDTLKQAGAAGTEAGSQIAAGAQKAEYSMMEARHGIMLTTEQFGVHMPRAIATMLAHVGPIGSVMAAAFPILGAVALIGIIAKVIEHFDKAKQKLEEYAKEEENVRAKTLETVSAMEIQNLKLEDQISKLEKRPEANKLKIALIEAANEADKLVDSLSKDIDKSSKLLETSMWSSFLIGITGDFSTTVEQTHQWHAALDTVQNDIKQLQSAQAHLRVAPTGLDPASQAAHKAAVEAVTLAYQNLGRDSTVALGLLRDYAPNATQQIHGLEMEAGLAARGMSEMREEAAKAGLEVKKLGAEEAEKGIKAHAEAVKLWNEHLKQLATEYKNLAKEQERQSDVELKAFMEGLKKKAENLKWFEGEIRKGQEAEFDGELKMSERATAAKAKSLQDQVAHHRITGAQYIAQITDLYNQDLQKQIAVLNEKEDAAASEVRAEAITRGLTNAQADAAALAARQKFEQQKLELIQKYNEQLNADIQKQLDKQAQQLHNFLGKFNSDFSNAFTNAMTTNEGFGRAMGKMWLQMGQQVDQFVMKLTLGMLEGLAIAELTGKTQKISAAKTAAANTYAAESGIPIIGPVIAPVMAAAAFAAVMSFDQGGIAPETGLALIHKREMVLRPELSEKVQDMADRAAPSGGGNDAHFHFHGFDGEDVERTFMRHLPALGNAWHAAQRGGHVDLPSAMRGK